MAVLHPDAGLAARQRQSQLTKPAGSLGRLEALACWLAERSGQVCPPLPQPGIAVFAGDHGVAGRWRSAFQRSHREMVKTSPVAAPPSMCWRARLPPCWKWWTLAWPARCRPNCRLCTPACAGTGNLRTEAAMSLDECRQALAIGRASARRLHARGATLLIAGDGHWQHHRLGLPGVRLHWRDARRHCRPGHPASTTPAAPKVAVVGEALARAQAAGAHDGESWLAQVGGLEIAAMAGLLLEAAALGIPALLDGFIATAAALAAAPSSLPAADWWLASHRSQSRAICAR